MWVFPVGLGACVLWGQRSDSCNIYTRLAAKVRKEPGKKNEAHMRVSEKKNNKATFCVSSWVRQIKRVFTCMYVSMSACVCVCVFVRKSAGKAGKMGRDGRNQPWHNAMNFKPHTNVWLGQMFTHVKAKRNQNNKILFIMKMSENDKKKKHILLVSQQFHQWHTKGKSLRKLSI